VDSRRGFGHGGRASARNLLFGRGGWGGPCGDRRWGERGLRNLRNPGAGSGGFSLHWSM